MPSAQQFNVQTQQPSNYFGDFIGGFINKSRENLQEQQDVNVLDRIFNQYEQEGQDIDNALFNTIKTPGLSPNKRVQTLQALVEIKKQNSAVLKAQQKQLRAQAEAQIEQAVLNDPATADMSPSELHAFASSRGIPPVNAAKIANLRRQEGREGRISKESLKKGWDSEINILRAEAKNEFDNVKKDDLERRIKEMVRERNRDLNRWDRGERKFTPKYQLDEGEQQAEAVTAAPVINSAIKNEKPVPQVGPGPVERPAADQAWLPPTPEMQQQAAAIQSAIQELAQALPPENFKGQVKWLRPEDSPDGKKHSFKSDGKTWQQIS